MDTIFLIGDRVCKGPDWKWGDQGGSDPKGTITDFDDEGWATVEWDNGEINGYRVGYDQCFDIALLREAAPDDGDDMVNRPAHYTCFEIEPLTFIMRNGLAFWQGNPIKYICRAGRKLYPGKDAVESEIVDLEKARRMLEMRIKTLQGDKSDCL